MGKKRGVKAKQIRKRMKHVKKGLSLAAVSLVLSNSSLVVLNSFAQGEVHAYATEETQVNPRSTTNHQLYGNLLTNPTMAGDPNQGTILGWTPSYCTNLNNYIDSNYSYKNNQYYINGCQASIYHTNSNEVVLNTGYAGNVNDTAAYVSLSQIVSRSNVVANRTYKASLFLKKSTGNVILRSSSGANSSGSANAWISPVTNQELTAEVKSDINSVVRMAFTARGGFVTFDESKTFLGLKYGAEWKQVDALFTSLDQTKLAPEVTAETIQAAKAAVDGIANNKDATEMNTAITKAQQLLKQQSEEAAQTTIDGLFQGDQLAADVTQEKLDQAQTLIDQVTDSAKKQALQAKLDQARDLLAKRTQEQAAQVAVDGLFQGDQLAEDVTKEKLDQAQALIDQVTDSTKKQAIQEKLDHAKTLYEERLVKQATEAVQDLFTDNTFTTLKSGVTQEMITRAQEKLAFLPETPQKETLEQQLADAQRLFNQIQENNQAEEVVKGLFADDSHQQLADGVTQDMINEAKEIIDGLDDSTVQKDLLTLIEKAQKLWDIQSFKITKIDEYKQGESSFIRGTYDGKYASYIRLIVNGKKEALLPLKETEDKSFEYYRKGLKPTDQVEVAIYNQNYQELAKQMVTITRGEPTKITKVFPYVEGKDTWISGTYEGITASYIGVAVNGVKKAVVSSKDLANHKFNYYLAGLKGTDQVEIKLYDEDYQEVAKQSVSITPVSKVEITQLDSYQEGQSEWITGKVNGDSARYVQLIVNGVKQGLVSSDDLSDGTIRYFKTGLKVTDRAELVLYDQNYQEVARKDVPIEGKDTTKITRIDPYEIGKSEWITGKLTGTAPAYIRVTVNGQKYALVPYKQSGQEWKYYLPGLKKSDQVNVVMYDQAYQELAQGTVSYK